MIAPELTPPYKGGDRVVLINKGGYDNYRGTIRRVFVWGFDWWADINWDCKSHPCTTPMETDHLKLCDFEDVCIDADLREAAETRERVDG